MKSGILVTAGIGAILMSAVHAAAQEMATLKVAVDQPGIAVSPMLYGVFFEEINRAGDGGIYPELLENRSFEDAETPRAWELLTSPGAQGSMTLETASPLNAKNPHSLKLQIANVAGGRVGIVNDGFRGRGKDPYKGIAVTKGDSYHFSLAARALPGFIGPLTATLETADGSVLANATLSTPGDTWQTFTATLTPNATSTAARLVVSAATPGTVYLDMVSLMPTKTWKNHGLRPDLLEMVEALHPAFVRFPGGCWVEGDRMATALRWKETIGPIDQRRTLPNLWGYQSTNGLGYFEYLQMCEDLKSEPLFVINVGMAHRDVAPLEKMDEYVQDALDAIEYANGPADSKWGSERAKAGHPAPFHLKYLEIGNENGGPNYIPRHKLFVDAIKAKYPQMQLITNVWKGTPNKSMPVELVDEHYYDSPSAFYGMARQYDKYDRNGWKVYVGEYAVTKECGAGNLHGALGEAVFMTGMERNSDVVTMASYAPLFCHVHYKGWNPNAINFDNSRVYGTPSYWVQQMFAVNRPDVILPVELTTATVHQPVRGLVGVGTWKTAAEFKDVQVLQDGKPLFAYDPQKGLSAWKVGKGQWEANGEVLRQSNANDSDLRLTVGEAQWQDYTIQLKARKTGGSEGFMLHFGLANANDRCRWNIGGWGNTASGIEGDGFDAVEKTPLKIETNRWYDLRLVVKGDRVKCFVDDVLVHDATKVGRVWLYAVAGKKKETGEIIVKVINTTDMPQPTQVSLPQAKVIGTSGRLTVLTSERLSDENTLDMPEKITPRTEALGQVSNNFTHTFPARSVSVLRLKTVP